MTNAFLRKGDFWSGVALAALGAWIVGQATRWVYLGDDGPGPGFFPLWYGGAMVVLSLLLVAGAARKPDREGPTPHRAAHWAAHWTELRRALTCWLAFVVCIALLKPLGFALAFALLTWFIVAVMYGQSQRKAWILAIGGAVLFELLFSWLLEIQLPRGLLFSAWSGR